MHRLIFMLKNILWCLIIDFINYTFKGNNWEVYTIERPRGLQIKYFYEINFYSQITLLFTRNIYRLHVVFHSFFIKKHRLLLNVDVSTKKQLLRTLPAFLFFLFFLFFIKSFFFKNLHRHAATYATFLQCCGM